jgi:hypothetical protein
MYTGILHTHTLVVVLFLLLYLVKTFLLVSRRDEALESFTQKTKWPERIISVLFLVTGFYLLFNTGNRYWPLYLKIGLVFASIPLAIIGFRKKKPALAILSVVLLLASYGLAEMNARLVARKPKPDLVAEGGEVAGLGKVLYGNYCSSCHGDNGAAGYSGAKNIALSRLDAAGIKDLIRNGKGAMPAFPVLSETDVDAIILHCQSLKTAP